MYGLMQRFLIFLIALLIGNTFLPLFAFPGVVAGTNPFDKDWLFHLGNLEPGNDSAWVSVELPHDWALDDKPGTTSPFDPNVSDGVSSGFTSGGIGWYRKVFILDAALCQNRVYLNFDGVYMNSDVWINNHFVGNHFYGYTPFQYEITSYLKWGERNEIRVKVNSTGTTSRWYSGAGIYRHVSLLVLPRLHINRRDICIKTSLENTGRANVDVTLNLNGAEHLQSSYSLSCAIISNGMVMSKKTIPFQAMKDGKVHFNVLMDEPRFWSVENPHRYNLELKLEQDGVHKDVLSLPFGIRTIEFDSVKGFLLNGKSMKLRGGCIHHDNGALGAMAFDKAEQRKIMLLKNSGYNAVRLAHNPPSEALLNACDSLGMLVIDECFDVWKYGHFTDDYSKHFAQSWQDDLESMILRDRNHPCIIMWSIGNEIKKTETKEMADLSRQLAEFVRNLDSTRPVTAGVNSVSSEKDAFLRTLDVAGYNYSPRQYVKGRKRNPGQLIYASESYASKSYDYWQDVLKFDWVIGDFVWTAIDYIGESSIGWNGYYLKPSFYPWHLAYCGDIDFCGHKRPQSYYRDTFWKDAPQAYIFVTPPVPSFPLNPEKEKWSIWDWPDVVKSWNYDEFEGVPFNVQVYSNCEAVELLLNGRSLGKKKYTKKDKNIKYWKVPYSHGTLISKGYCGEQVTTSDTLSSSAEASSIEIAVDKKLMQANSRDLCYVDVFLVDKNGVLDNGADNLLSFKVEGAGKLMAVANANPMSVESFHGGKRRAWRGHCQAILQAASAGELKLTVSAIGMADKEVVIQVK